MGDFKQNIINLYGKKGVQWLERLPALTADLAQKYHLHDLTPVSNLSFNYVARGYQHDVPIILKVGMDNDALDRENQCLKAFAGRGVPKVLASQPGMMILEKAEPGISLKTYFPHLESESIQVFCQIAQKLHEASVPRDNRFPHLRQICERLDQPLDIPKPILLKARALRDELIASTTKEVLLHGDLHHDNILQMNKTWLAIDPKGFIGDPAFEPAAFLCNPMPDILALKDCKRVIKNRIAISADYLGMSAKRIAQWNYVKGVLAWAWMLDDNLNPEYFKKYIHFLSE